MEGWLLVETGRGGVGVRTYWCVATSHALNTCEVVDSVDGVLQLSLNWATLHRKCTQGETWSMHAQTLCI